MESFFDFYTLHKSTDNLTERFIKTPINKSCRFCNKSYPEVSFETIPHVVPELFGRNKTSSNFECDNCNKKFQRFETDTSTMIQHYLALLNIKSKKGIPNFQSKKGQGENSTTLKSLNNDRNLNFGTNLDDFEYNEEEKNILIKFRTRNFRPYSVYKVFLKMGICLLKKDELDANSHYLEFLNSETPIINGMQMWTTYRYMLKTKFNIKPSVNLYKAKETLVNGVAFPEYLITINFANIIFQFFLPISEKNMAEHKPEHHLQFVLFPSFVLEDINKLKAIEVYHFDLDQTDKISINDKVVLYYAERIRSTIN